jgi:hypothetical protein
VQLDRALRFMFLDPDWPMKLGVAILVLGAPGLATAIASATLDTVLGLAVFGLALLVQLVGAIILYTHYSRIIESIALEGRDLPLPPEAPILDMIERAIRLVCFGLILSVTMIPLLCVVACPVAVIAPMVDSAGGVVAALLATILLLFTVGLIVAAYSLLGFSRYVVTGDFGGSLNPGTLLRIFQSNPGGWLLAAFFPVLLGVIISIIRQVFIWLLPDAGVLDDVLNTLLSTPISAYTTLVGFHLAGQAYRLSNQLVPNVVAGDFVPTRNY